MNIKQFWQDVLLQDRDAIREYFSNDAYVNWHCTNEHFTVEEFIRANCEYPGEWDGAVERIENAGDTVITVTHVYPKDKSLSFHVISFIRIRQDFCYRLCEENRIPGVAKFSRLWLIPKDAEKPVDKRKREENRK